MILPDIGLLFLFNLFFCMNVEESLLSCFRNSSMNPVEATEILLHLEPTENNINSVIGILKTKDVKLQCITLIYLGRYVKEHWKESFSVKLKELFNDWFFENILMIPSEHLCFMEEILLNIIYESSAEERSMIENIIYNEETHNRVFLVVVKCLTKYYLNNDLKLHISNEKISFIFRKTIDILSATSDVDLKNLFEILVNLKYLNAIHTLFLDEVLFTRFFQFYMTTSCGCIMGRAFELLLGINIHSILKVQVTNRCLNVLTNVCDFDTFEKGIFLISYYLKDIVTLEGVLSDTYFDSLKEIIRFPENILDTAINDPSTFCSEYFNKDTYSKRNLVYHHIIQLASESPVYLDHMLSVCFSSLSNSKNPCDVYSTIQILVCLSECITEDYDDVVNKIFTILDNDDVLLRCMLYVFISNTSFNINFGEDVMIKIISYYREEKYQFIRFYCLNSLMSLIKNSNTINEISSILSGSFFEGLIPHIYEVIRKCDVLRGMELLEIVFRYFPDVYNSHIFEIISYTISLLESQVEINDYFEVGECFGNILELLISYIKRVDISSLYKLYSIILCHFEYIPSQLQIKLIYNLDSILRKVSEYKLDFDYGCNILMNCSLNNPSIFDSFTDLIHSLLILQRNNRKIDLNLITTLFERTLPIMQSQDTELSIRQECIKINTYILYATAQLSDVSTIFTTNISRVTEFMKSEHLISETMHLIDSLLVYDVNTTLELLLSDIFSQWICCPSSYFGYGSIILVPLLSPDKSLQLLLCITEFLNDDNDVEGDLSFEFEQTSVMNEKLLIIINQIRSCDNRLFLLYYNQASEFLEKYNNNITNLNTSDYNDIL